MSPCTFIGPEWILNQGPLSERRVLSSLRQPFSFKSKEHYCWKHDVKNFYYTYIGSSRILDSKLSESSLYSWPSFVSSKSKLSEDDLYELDLLPCFGQSWIFKIEKWKHRGCNRCLHLYIISIFREEKYFWGMSVHLLINVTITLGSPQNIKNIIFFLIPLVV